MVGNQSKGYAWKFGFKSSLLTEKSKAFNYLNKEIVSNLLASITLRKISTDQNKKWCVLLAKAALSWHAVK